MYSTTTSTPPTYSTTSYSAPVYSTPSQYTSPTYTTQSTYASPIYSTASPVVTPQIVTTYPSATSSVATTAPSTYAPATVYAAPTTTHASSSYYDTSRVITKPTTYIAAAPAPAKQQQPAGEPKTIVEIKDRTDVGKLTMPSHQTAEQSVDRKIQEETQVTKLRVS